MSLAGRVSYICTWRTVFQYNWC